MLWAVVAVMTGVSPMLFELTEQGGTTAGPEPGCRRRTSPSWRVCRLGNLNLISDSWHVRGIVSDSSRFFFLTTSRKICVMRTGSGSRLRTHGESAEHKTDTDGNFDLSEI